MADVLLDLITRMPGKQKDATRRTAAIKACTIAVGERTGFEEMNCGTRIVMWIDDISIPLLCMHMLNCAGSQDFTCHHCR